eukprot:4943467-Heterocapsa_arctica.AAC.1
MRASADDAEAVAAGGSPHLPAGRQGGQHGCAPQGPFLRCERQGLAVDGSLESGDFAFRTHSFVGGGFGFWGVAVVEVVPPVVAHGRHVLVVWVGEHVAHAVD